MNELSVFVQSIRDNSVDPPWQDVGRLTVETEIPRAVKMVNEDGDYAIYKLERTRFGDILKEHS